MSNLKTKLSILISTTAVGAILALLVLMPGPNGVAKAVTLAPKIGGSGTLNQSFTTDVDVNGLNVGSYYQLMIFKHVNDAPAGSWNSFCSTQGASNWWVAGINFGWDNGYLSLTNSFGSINEISRTADGRGITLRITASFDQTYDQAYLIYALVPTPSFDTQIGDVQNCTRLALYEIKGPFKIVAGTDSGGGGGTTPVVIASPGEVAGKLGTAQVEGFSLGSLRNLFNSSGGTSLDTNFPVLGIILKSLLYLAGLLLLLSVVYAGIILIRSTSDEEAAVAKKNLVWSLTGAFIIVIANWLVDTVIKFIQ